MDFLTKIFPASPLCVFFYEEKPNAVITMLFVLF